MTIRFFSSFGEFIDAHADAVGDLLVGEQEYFLTDNLGGKKSLALIGKLSFRKKLRSLGQSFFDQIQYQGQVFSFEGADGDDFLTGQQFRATLDQRQQLPLGNQVDFVQKDEHRTLYASQSLGNSFVFRADSAARVEQPQHAIDFMQTLQGHLDHAPVHQRARLVYSRGIQKNDLRARAGFNAGDAIARRLRFGRNDCNFFPEQIIQQRRLADVGPADDCNVA